MRNIKKLLTLTFLFLVLFSFPVSATAGTDSEKFQFQLELSGMEELLPGDISNHTILVKNHTDKRLAYRVDAVTFTGSEALAEELELSLLDGDRSFLHGTVASLSRTNSFEQILAHPEGRDKRLRLRLHLRKEATNTVAGDTLTLSIHLSGTDAPLKAWPPEETEKPAESQIPSENETPSESQKPPESIKPEETMKPPPSSGAGTQDVENASDGRPSGGSQTGGGHGGTMVRGEGYQGKTESLFSKDSMSDVEPSSGREEYADGVIPFTRKEAAGAVAERDFSAAKSAGKKENEKKNSTTDTDGNVRLTLGIREIKKKHASVQISTAGGSGTIQDPITVYIGPTRQERALLLACLFLFLLLLILIIFKCWLLYRATQSEDQEDRVYASGEQGV